MIKILFFVVFLFFTSCKTYKPETCDCKFMLDITVQNEKPEFIKYSELFDEDLYFSCVKNYLSENHLDSNLDPLILDVFYFYTNLCPEYEISFD